MYLGVLVFDAAKRHAVEVITERQQAMLDFERTFWTLDEPKDVLIRARFQCSVDDYYAELNELLDDPAALQHDELVVRRLQRHRRRGLNEQLHRANQGGS